MSGKKSDMKTDALLVVAGALKRADGLWLMHKRPLQKHHGGLWEFPGGKVEQHESPREALCRELNEELGVSSKPADCEALFFAESDQESGVPAIVILLYKIERWSGEPRALEGEAVGWFTPKEVDALAKPPLDRQLAARLFV